MTLSHIAVLHLSPISSPSPTTYLSPLTTPTHSPFHTLKIEASTGYSRLRYEGFLHIGNCFYFGPFIRFTFQLAQICLVCVCVYMYVHVYMYVYVCVCVCVGRNNLMSLVQSIDRYHL